MTPCRITDTLVDILKVHLFSEFIHARLEFIILRHALRLAVVPHATDVLVLLFDLSHEGAEPVLVVGFLLSVGLLHLSDALMESHLTLGKRI